jgi:hypothetical protein
MITSLTFMITLLGSATVALSGYVGLRFFIKSVTMRGDGRRLTGALTFMLMGELILGLGTLCFAIAAHTKHLPMIPVEVQSIARLIMFGCTAASTLHLFMVISRLDDE